MNPEAAVALFAILTFGVGLVLGYMIASSAVREAYDEGYDEGHEDARHGVRHQALRRVGE